MSKKKILIFTDWYLPAVNAGGPVRSVSAIVDALKHEFEISVLTSDRDFGAEDAFPDVVVDEWVMENGFRLQYVSPKKLKIAVRNELQLDYDKIYMNSLFSLPFTIRPLWILSKSDKKNKVVLATRGMLGQGALELKSFKKNIFLILSKVFKLYHHITFHASSQLEKEEIRAVYGHSCRVVTLENLAACKQDEIYTLKKSPNQLKLLFVSRISPKKNLLFLLDVLSKIDRKIELDIFGPIEDENYWKKCKSLMNKSHHSIHYGGVIKPSELTAYITRYHLFALPTLNENFGHIILETLNASVPVLISDQTPWLGLEALKAGKELPLADKEAWVNWLVKFYEMEDQEYQLWRRGAWNLAQNKLQQEGLIKEYVQLFS